MKQVERIRANHASYLDEYAEIILREARRKLGYSQASVAEKLGCSQSKYSRIEAGLRIPKDFAEAKAISLILELDDEVAARWYQLLFGIADHQNILNGELQDSFSREMMDTLAYAFRLRDSYPDAIVKVAKLYDVYESAFIELRDLKSYLYSKVNHN